MLAKPSTLPTTTLSIIDRERPEVGEKKKKKKKTSKGMSSKSSLDDEEEFP